MDHARHEQVKVLLELAMALRAQDRISWLKGQQADPQVIQEVARLLAANDDSAGETAPLAPGPGVPHADHGASIKPPEQIGHYRIQHELGRGGMGVVYLAMQEEGSITRRVALKIVKLGTSTEEILHRFNVERRLLSSLNHAGIAKILDAGVTDDGRPYFVMEFIEGMHIDRFCEAHELSVHERLDLFRKVCAVVHYAHQNLIVHRDLKPSNILVGADGEVKLLDFGIAKLLRPDLIGIPFATLPEARLMTPEYASPEQVRGEPVGTSSDVYALGVLLYELLTGRRPYELKSRIREELIRVICEVEPEKPSIAVTHASEVTTSDGFTRTVTPEETARTRGGATSRLRRDLSGDLDNIVMMALRKVARRRYESAEQMSRDIQLLLDGRPVIATAETSLYVLGKFVKRNKAVVTGLTAVILSLTLGLAGTWWQYNRAEATQRASEESTAAMFSSTKDFVKSFANDLRTKTGSLHARLALAEVSLRVLDTLKKQGVVSPDHEVLRALAIEQLGSAKGGIDGPSLGDRTAGILDYQRALAIWKAMDSSQPEVRRGILNNLVKQSEINRNIKGTQAGAESALRCAEAEAFAALPSIPTYEDRRARAEYLRELAEVRFGQKDYIEASRAMAEGLDLRQSLLREAEQSSVPAKVAETRRLVVIGVFQRIFLRKNNPEFDAACSGSLGDDLKEVNRLTEATVRSSPEPTATALRDRRNSRSDLAEWNAKQGTPKHWDEAMALIQQCLAEAESIRESGDAVLRDISDHGTYLLVAAKAHLSRGETDLAGTACKNADAAFDEALRRSPEDRASRFGKQEAAKLLKEIQSEKR